MLIPIVNTNDTIISHKEREDIDFKKDIFRTASLWITNSRGDILLAQRKLTKKVDPGKWAEAVGGTVEGSDSYENTVFREAEEELGIKGIGIILGPKQLITTPCSYFVQWYTAVIDKDLSEFSIQAEEVEQIAWIPRAQLEKELIETPDKYIEAMGSITALFAD
ncbi:MAG TPA: NUDIX domain-containing protein [Candidatus Saccharimonadales bacterium]|nr:NUDIX domain-containing protein [Candidatus Saccharimonadales bacterium]